ncbi:MAG: aminopeptidase [Thermoplasmata archaeon]
MTVSQKRIRQCAKSIVQSSNLRKGDGVVVKGGAHAISLLEEIALECYRKGATPSILVSTDRLAKSVYDEIPASTLSTTPKQYLGMIKACDMLISVEELDNPSIAERFPRNKLQARQKAMLPLYDVLYHPHDGKKWLYAGWPTRSAARSFGVRYSELEDIVVGGISVAPEFLMRTGKRLHSKLENASWIHVWDNKGTDFRVKVEGRRHNIDDGLISEEDYKVGDRGCNLPAGELFIAPHETVGSGALYCPITRDGMSDKIVKDVHLVFRNGVIQLDKTTAGKNGDALVSSFKECEQVDKMKYDPIRTRNIAELGIGFNPRIKRPIGYILPDEKVMGTVHLAFGSNRSYGGTSESTLHWDFVSAPGVSIEAQLADDATIQVMRNGKFL